jgi:hypothetical protein
MENAQSSDDRSDIVPRKRMTEPIDMALNTSEPSHNGSVWVERSKQTPHPIWINRMAVATVDRFNLAMDSMKRKCHVKRLLKDK